MDNDKTMYTEKLPKKTLKFIWHFIKYKKKIFSLLIICECLYAINLSLKPYIIKIIVDNVASSSYENLLRIIIIYIIVEAFEMINFTICDLTSTNFYPKLKSDIVESVTKYVSNHSYSYFQDKFAGNLAHKIKDVSKGTVEVLQFMVYTAFSATISIIIASFMLTKLNSMLAITVWMWAMLFIGISAVNVKKSQMLAYKFSKSASALMGYIVDILGNMLSVQIFSRQKEEMLILKNKAKDILEKEVCWRKFLITIYSTQNLLTLFMLGITLFIMANNNTKISPGDFSFIFIIISKIINMIRGFAEKSHRASEYFGLLHQGLEVINTPHQVKDAPDAKEIKIFKGEIVFNDVSFNYPNSSSLFINNSIKIHAGEKVGLVGYSGSGKSTFVHLIPRLYDLQGGKILIDNQDIAKCTVKSLRQQIAIIPQEPSLFHRTIRENISYGKIDATEEEIINAAKKASAHLFISQFQYKYDTFVGERGMKLSGGQKQRIAIARAILKNVPIIILDEATSALDSMTELEIQRNFNKIMHGKTTIIIAHRLSTLFNLDRIIVFNNGNIVEDGSHQELAKAGGIYSELLKKQSDGFLRL